MKISILVILLSFVLSELALAHSGRTNASGCHNNRKTGGYHCHGGGSRSSYKSHTPSKSYSTPSKPSASTTTDGSSSFYKSRTPTKSYNTASKPSASTTSDLVLQTQKNLNRLGFDAGPEDGIMGKKTKEAIKLFQRKVYEDVDGKVSYSLLEKLKRAVEG